MAPSVSDDFDSPQQSPKYAGLQTGTGPGLDAFLKFVRNYNRGVYRKSFDDAEKKIKAIVDSVSSRVENLSTLDRKKIRVQENIKVWLLAMQERVMIVYLLDSHSLFL